MKAVLSGLFAASAMALLSETVLPDGKLRKCVRFFVGVAVAVIAFSPIGEMIEAFKNGKFNIPSHETYLEAFEATDSIENDIEEFLLRQGIDATVKVYTYDGEAYFALFSVKNGDREYVKKAISAILKLSKDKIAEYGQKGS